MFSNNVVGEGATPPGPADCLAIGGESLTYELVGIVRQHAPQTRLVNEYGPTETVVGCCTYEVTAGDRHDGAVPIGRPIANTQLFVLDTNGAPTPVGVSGELYIGGDGVARGYVNRADLTARSFVPDPFSGRPGARMYRTGDTARYRADGTLEFIGRVDHQVKIRGFRIELGEIEGAILGQPGVRECVVVVNVDSGENQRLVAYFARKPDSPPASDLRASLQKTLPEHMVPHAFVELESLPLTSNGKVDRKALPDPDFGALGSLEYVAPRTPLEDLIAGIWCELLQQPRVGAHDNFFALGGHSLLATRAIARMRRLLSVELSNAC